MAEKLSDQANKRRTFTIISHPDVGKTTIAKQMLLFGGVIRGVGTVKARKSGHFATSDWMEIEKKRGVSVTNSVMQFEYEGKRIDILDTPGRQDLSENTYHTLMAVDAAVMVVDSAKGTEPQTKKLFKVVHKRGILIFTFINKFDRDGQDGLDLVAELEDILGIKGVAVNWPIGSGKSLKGLYDIQNNRVELYRKDDDDRFIGLDSEGKLLEGEELSHDNLYLSTLDDVELIKEAGNTFDEEGVLASEQTPVLFGSALTNFGVEAFLKSFIDLAPAPSSHKVNDDKELKPDNEEFSSFIFRIQANMNPNHRGRIAFIRIGSGGFEEGLDVTLARTGKAVCLNNATEFMSNERVQISKAVAGDIVGLCDTGNFQISDNIYTGKRKIVYGPLPEFTPELFMWVIARNVVKQKSFHKGMNQLVQEGMVQLYRNFSTDEYILGAVGQFQFEIFEFRIQGEYNSEVEMTSLDKRIARWIDPERLDPKTSSSRNLSVKGRYDKPLFLFENEFAMRWFHDKYPDVKLTEEL